MKPMDADSAALRELRQIPGVGPSIARDLLGMGIRRVADLRGADPEALYQRFCAEQGMHIDRCMLYVFRGAVYYATEEHPDPALLQWWAWKDGGAAYTGNRR
jgi:hypothetical protein